MQDLLRFHPDVDWTGVIEENGMGPGSPLLECRLSGMAVIGSFTAGLGSWETMSGQST